MYREAQLSDRSDFCSLWQQVFGDPLEFAADVFDKFCGVENIYVCRQGDTLAAILCAVPVTHRQQKGVYYYGLATHPDFRRQGIMGNLMEIAQQKSMQKGAQFICLIPAGEELYRFYQKRGYKVAFRLRKTEKAISRNLWARGEFDSLNYKQLNTVRSRFAQNAILLNDEAMRTSMFYMYRDGATIVSNKYGYGVYFEKNDVMEFTELFAVNDDAAMQLMEAARQRTGKEKALVTLTSWQEVFYGEGKPFDYGMIKALQENVEYEEMYMHFMMDYIA